MALRFTIENQQTMTDGGPVTFTVSGKRSIDIGRDQHLDWTLPDPTRFVSSKHCEVHFKDGGYWLHDVSTNGTFLNGADQRMRGPHLLKGGDRFIIGQYIVVVSGETDDGFASASMSQLNESSATKQTDYQQIWANDRDAPPPISPQHLKIAREAARPVNPEFLDWAAGVPEPEMGLVRRSVPAAKAFEPRTSTPSAGGMGWDSGPLPSTPPPPEALPVPTPRRPLWSDQNLLDDAGIAPPVPRPVEPARSPLAAKAQTPADAFVDDAPVPVPAPARAAGPVAPSGEGRHAQSTAFTTQVARGAGLPDDFFSAKDPDELAEQLGGMMRLTIDNLMILLQARHQAKRMTRSTTQTTIQAIENNPLKFSPTAEEAMRILFGPATRSYLDAGGALMQGFGDLKSHQLKTYMAMQHAVAQLMAEIDPLKIAEEAASDPGKKSWLQNNKARLWDEFVMRWKTQFGRENRGPIDTFMLHFADFYDRDDKSGF